LFDIEKMNHGKDRKEQPKELQFFNKSGPNKEISALLLDTCILEAKRLTMHFEHSIMKSF
jgi:hypothetical protein